MNTIEIASQMRAEADRLIKAADLIAPRQLQPVAPTPIHNRNKQKRTGRRRLSAETRRKLSEAQQRRRERERAMSGQTQQAA
jgi:hypothetical protein